MNAGIIEPSQISEALLRSEFAVAKIPGRAIERLFGAGYLTAPASRSHHFAEKGGLAAHSMNVAAKLVGLGAFDDLASCYRVGLLHDIVKLLCYKPDGDGWRKVSIPYPGHGTASAMIAADFGIDLSPVERAAITWHMGVFNLTGDLLDAYGEACATYGKPVVLTHAADFLASIDEKNLGKGAK